MNQDNSINKLQKILRYKFKTKKNLINSLTHPSYHQDLSKGLVLPFNNFERYEFLGDRVLGLVISSLIFDKFNKNNEGDLTKKLSYLVQKEFLYKIALELKIDNYLQYNKKKINDRLHKSILSDTIESIIGAIYIDGGYKAAHKVITHIWKPYLDFSSINMTDAKTQLQEISQKKFKILPIYKLLEKKGPPHSPIFTISLKALKLKEIKASAGSIRDAEKKAAKIILDIISEK